jgi:hypothetical protein
MISGRPFWLFEMTTGRPLGGCDALQWQQPPVDSDVQESSASFAVPQQPEGPTNPLKHIGIREPFGQMHSKWGDAEKTVVQTVSQTVRTENRRLPDFRMIE